ncbi:MAG: hypothetical protein IJS59_03385 [Bacteroidaceae bacterium]|nr:hypothetical protein [Bacteroidaceae bacterium]
MENSILTKRLARQASRVCAAMMLMGGAWCFSSCSDDLLTGTPEWLGSSIYEELESRGNYTQTLALIDDPVFRDNPTDTQTSFHKLLAKTGSMTLFVADDAAWQRYLSRRGLTSVTQLPSAEKKNLLKGAMVNNAYLIELLSNTSGNPPTEGACLRRETRQDVYDSIPYVTRAQMPPVNPYRIDNQGNQIDYWSRVRSRDGIYIFKDNNPAPMMHFLPDYMKNNTFSSDDVRTLTNGAADDAVNTSYVNGQKVVEKDITCQNGYIHVLQEVPEPLVNMADLVGKKAQFSIFNELLDRFSYPQFLVTQSVNGVEDSLFVKRYFYSTSNTDQFIAIPETNRSVTTLLAYDPGYNLYQANGLKMAEDGAAMFVPTNEAMEAYLHAEGAELGQKYGYDWSHIPDNVVLPFLKNCFQTSMRSTVPSKFATTKNTASEAMGIELADIDSAFIACNGVVYQTNKVYIAPEYQSVFYPAVLRGDEDLRTIYNAIADERYKGNASAWTLNEFTAYLNSMASSYSFLIPDDHAFEVTYFDPYSFSSSYSGDPVALKFYVKPGSDNPVDVDFYRAQVDTIDGHPVLTATDEPARLNNVTTNLSFLNNRMHDIVDNLIIPHGLRGTQTFREGQTIYTTKGYSPVKVQFTGGQVSGIAGSYQMERGEYIPVDPEQIFDKTEAGNGVSYVLPTIPTTTLTSPYKVITDTITHPGFTEFARLFGGCSFLGTTVTGRRTTIDQAIDFFGNYHYTIYVPDNASIRALTDAGKLPTWDTDDAWEAFKLRMDTIETEADNILTEDQVDEIIDSITVWRRTISNIINNFVRYHIQDAAIYLGGADSTGVYETATMDETINRYRRLNVANSSGRITITDAAGNIANVATDQTHSNLVTRQYIFDTGNKAGHIYLSSYAVIHQIDKALQFGDAGFMPTDFPEPNLESVLAYLNTHRHQSKPRR